MLLFYGKIKYLTFDPCRPRWSNGDEFVQFTTKKGRDLFKARKPPLMVASKKWSGLLPADFRFQWRNNWMAERVSKEAHLIWQLWHKAVAVNLWRGQMSTDIDTTCPTCDEHCKESVIHRFGSCDLAQSIWKFSAKIINKLGTHQSPLVLGRGELPWNLPQMRQAIFADRLPRKFR